VKPLIIPKEQVAQNKEPLLHSIQWYIKDQVLKDKGIEDSILNPAHSLIPKLELRINEGRQIEIDPELLREIIDGYVEHLKGWKQKEQLWIKHDKIAEEIKQLEQFYRNNF